MPSSHHGTSHPKVVLSAVMYFSCIGRVLRVSKHRHEQEPRHAMHVLQEPAKSTSATLEVFASVQVV